MPDFYIKRKKFNDFIKKQIKLTDKVDKKIINSDKFNNDYDIFITGSDQVWNYELTNDSAYMLDFVKNSEKKRSYAASFGIDKIPFNLVDLYRTYLADFHTILLREKTGKKIIKNLLNRTENVVLDPVFLLNKQEWDNVVGKTKFENIKNQYIIVYFGTLKIVEFARYLSKKYELPIIFISGGFKLKLYGKLNRRLGPEEFVSAIKNARFVLTGSFHAVVFSIIYNKTFFINIDKNGKARASRQKDLLSLLQIGDREIINHRDDMDFTLIQWEKINKKLDIERKKSLNELKNMLVMTDNKVIK